VEKREREREREVVLCELVY